MNFSKLKNRAGFTLIELIVVIAIMAILAGVAVPVYSGYIEKAEKASDLQLLGAVNSAFAAAIIEQGGDPYDLSRADAPINEGELGTITVAPNDASKVNLSGFSEAFERYFAGNSRTFKSIEVLNYDHFNAVFVADEMTTIEIKDADGNVIKTFNIPASDIANFEKNTLYTELGIPGLTEKVDYVSGFATDMMGEGGSLTNYIMSDAQKEALAKQLGYADYATMSTSNDGPYAMAVGTWMEKFLEEGYDDDEAFDLAEKQVMANYAVLTSAQTASSMSGTNVMNMLTSAEPKEMIKSGDTTQVLTNAALAYGMYTSYAYSSMGNPDAQAKTQNPDAIMDALKDEGFQNYLKTEQAKTDMEGYLSALSMASNVAQSDKETVETVLTNGYSDTSIQDLITQVMGSKS